VQFHPSLIQQCLELERYEYQPVGFHLVFFVFVFWFSFSFSFFFLVFLVFLVFIVFFFFFFFFFFFVLCCIVVSCFSSHACRSSRVRLPSTRATSW
jgi:hypothetical protein